MTDAGLVIVQIDCLSQGRPDKRVFQQKTEEGKRESCVDIEGRFPREKKWQEPIPWSENCMAFVNIAFMLIASIIT